MMKSLGSGESGNSHVPSYHLISIFQRTDSHVNVSDSRLVATRSVVLSAKRSTENTPLFVDITYKFPQNTFMGQIYFYIRLLVRIAFPVFRAAAGFCV
jgi:hypothetical protein